MKVVLSLSNKNRRKAFNWNWKTTLKEGINPLYCYHFEIDSLFCIKYTTSKDSKVTKVKKFFREVNLPSEISTVKSCAKCYYFNILFFETLEFFVLMKTLLDKLVQSHSTHRCVQPFWFFDQSALYIIFLVHISLIY